MCMVYWYQCFSKRFYYVNCKDLQFWYFPLFHKYVDNHYEYYLVNVDDCIYIKQTWHLSLDVLVKFASSISLPTHTFMYENAYMCVSYKSDDAPKAYSRDDFLIHYLMTSEGEFPRVIPRVIRTLNACWRRHCFALFLYWRFLGLWEQ